MPKEALPIPASLTRTARQGAWAGGSDTPEMRQIRVGFMPLTDCAPIAVAAAMGFDKKYGISILPQREASWAAVRDKLLGNAIEVAHSLYGMIYGVQLGIGGPRCDMAVLMTLNHNGQAITLSKRLLREGISTGETLRRQLHALGRARVFAHTFPTGTHAMWLYYWLAAHDIHPITDVQCITVPPPQMMEKLRACAMDGYSAGEPWNARAVREGVGFTATTSQQIWPDHPEKVLAARRDFAEQCPNTARALIMAMLEAARFIDIQKNRTTVARIIASREYIDVDVDVVEGRLQGDYDDGRGRQWRDPHGIRFHGDGSVNYPYLSDGMWFMTQQRRWGLIDVDPDYRAIAERVNCIDLYSEAAAALGVQVPASPLRSSTLMDGRVWDGADPAGYARAFPLGALRAPAAHASAEPTLS